MNAEDLIAKVNAGKPGEHAIYKPDSIRATRKIFACPVCGDGYDTVEEMMECFTRPTPPTPWKVGDLVLIPGKWRGWVHSNSVSRPPVDVVQNDPWFAALVPAKPKAESHFDRIGHYHSWYVITAIYDYEHKFRHVVFGLLGEPAQYGWNVEKSHCSMFKEPASIEGVPVPPPSAELRRQAALLAKEGYVSYSLL